MVEAKIYVEGGGRSSVLRTKCREGFRKFLIKAGFTDHMPRIVACGSRQEAFDDFCTAFRKEGSSKFIVLLVDSEGPIAPKCGPWIHLKQRAGDGWDKPRNATDDHVHLMVQCMEAWFFADKDALSVFYGQKFNRNALPDRIDIENILKDAIFSTLERATNLSISKGKYSKSDHSFDILSVINPSLVQNASPHAKRFVETLKRKMQPEA